MEAVGGFAVQRAQSRLWVTLPQEFTPRSSPGDRSQLEIGIEPLHLTWDRGDLIEVRCGDCCPMCQCNIHLGSRNLLQRRSGFAPHFGIK